MSKIEVKAEVNFLAQAYQTSIMLNPPTAEKKSLNFLHVSPIQCLYDKPVSKKINC